MYDSRFLSASNRVAHPTYVGTQRAVDVWVHSTPQARFHGTTDCLILLVTEWHSALVDGPFQTKAGGATISVQVGHDVFSYNLMTIFDYFVIKYLGNKKRECLGGWRARCVV